MKEKIKLKHSASRSQRVQYPPSIPKGDERNWLVGEQRQAVARPATTRLSRNTEKARAATYTVLQNTCAAKALHGDR